MAFLPVNCYCTASAASVLFVLLTRLLLVFAADSTLRELCAKDEQFYRGQCYYFKNDVGMSFEAARTFCIKRQSHMAKIVDSAQNRWLLTQDRTRFGRWIGLMRIDEGAGFQFHWVQDDSVPLYTNFNDQKMDYDNQRCIYMDTDGRWADNTCNQPYNVMCERNPLDASILGLQKNLNNSFADVQSRLTKLEHDVSAGLNDSLRAGGGNGSASTATSLKTLALLLTAMQKDSTDARTKTNAASHAVQDVLLKLTKTVTALSAQLDHTKGSASSIQKQLDIIVAKVNSGRRFANDYQLTTTSLHALESHLNASDAKLNATTAHLEALLFGSPTATATFNDSSPNTATIAALHSSINRGGAGPSIVYSRISLALMLMILLLQIIIIYIVVLMGIFFRRRYKWEKSSAANNHNATPLQYNVSTATFGRRPTGAAGAATTALAMRAQATGISSSSDGQFVYEELDSVRAGGGGNSLSSTARVSSNKIDDIERGRSPSINTMRTDSVYMLSTVDGGAEADAAAAAAAAANNYKQPPANGTLPRVSPLSTMQHNNLYFDSPTTAAAPTAVNNNNYAATSDIVHDEKQNFVQLGLLNSSPASK